MIKEPLPQAFPGWVDEYVLARAKRTEVMLTAGGTSSIDFRLHRVETMEN
jgi:hypothetical protein